ncbi:MAG: tetratricopeptide repeat protein [Candidatus Cloacimonadaceae bacterium]|jgi:tetratricopeptide (TPR) repeat protein|nr:tetratricopeptide repeat protein [Candidatus Cloacimonadota bacterium]MDY0127058.1 tetratricopeptide repeat protein [Candidatus Cloacimonadaceae bacterium]MCB5255657.1 tetratricopeptide repeat protein [Candidatus Cloacimonadota bacterium]MCK9178450.1 tetratricopeptide repeat protein [Candidatus Cloacimonadota bacterium]MCK9242613.1 tetratricopeptide repeat protein [Candidatus Cloacimonadota bacterium]
MSGKQKILLSILAFLLLLLILELVLRPQVFRNSLGRELMNLKRYESAQKLFAKDAENESAVSAGNLAKSRYKKGDFSEAESASEEALTKDPEAAALHYDRGNIAFQQEDYEAAVKSYEQALLSDPTDEDTKANLELALKKLDENPPPPEPEPEPDEEQRDEEEVRNILEALDNLEARERKNQNDRTPPKTQNWW